MPWNNQSGGGGGGGGWKSGGGGNGGGPWGQGPWGPGQGGGGQQPDLEEMLKRGQNRMKQVMGGGGVPGPLLIFALALLVAAAVWIGFFFRVNTDELGVVMRFGEFVRQEPPGLHMKLPWPVEDVELVPVTKQKTAEIGFRSAIRDGAAETDKPEESLMLTGDENIVDIDFAVQWRIKDAAQYLFNIEDQENTVKEVSESAMREVVGQSEIQFVLTEGREKVESGVEALIQTTLDRYGAGIDIDRVVLKEVSPPNEVIEAFHDVQAARIDNARLQNVAAAYKNKVVPEARGEAEKILQAAQGYKQGTVAEAQGQSSRFLQIYEEYKKAPDVTRQRIFLETMERVFKGTDKVILDSKQGQGVVPYLPLDQLRPQPQPKQTSEGAN